MPHAIARVAVAAAAATAIVLGAATAAADGYAEAAQGGVTFILSTQAEDGGFGPLGQSLDAIIALRSAGLGPATIARGQRTASEYLEAHAAEAAESPALAAKAALGAVALGLDPRQVGGVDLIALVEGSFDPATGLYAADAFSQSLAILGLACTGTGVPEAATDALREAALEDGGWGFGGASDPDTTALALQALLAKSNRGADADVLAAFDYLQSTQLPDGGWGYGESNTSSTAFVVQAILAAGDDPASAHYLAVGGNPLAYLAAQQGEDGSFSGFDRAFATNQAVPALAGRSFCDAPNTAIAAPSPEAPKAGTGLVANRGTRPAASLAMGLGLALLAFSTSLGLATAER